MCHFETLLTTNGKIIDSLRINFAYEYVADKLNDQYY